MYYPLRAKVLPSPSNGTHEVVDYLEDVGAAATLEFFKMNAQAKLVGQLHIALILPTFIQSHWQVLHYSR
jgi:hypothetical protein